MHNRNLSPSPQLPINQQQTSSSLSPYEMKLMKKILYLSKNELHKSAILTASLLCNYCEAQGSEESRIASLCVFADALKADGQVKRAIENYREVLNMLNNLNVEEIIEPGFENFYGGGEDEKRALGVGGMMEEGNNENNPKKTFHVIKTSGEVRFALAQCFVSLKEDTQAIEVLLGIPKEKLTLGGIMLLTRLKRKVGAINDVKELYKQALKKECFNLESALILLEMEETEEEVLSLIQKKGGNLPPPFFCLDLIHAHALNEEKKMDESVLAFQKMISGGFGKNVHILNEMAKIEVQRGNRDLALALFSRSRSMDCFNNEGMDVYASLIRGNNNESKLSSLTHEMLSFSSENAPEPWVAAALLSEMNRDIEKSLEFVNKALSVDSVHLPAYHYKGALHLGLGETLESLSAYSRAYKIKRDFNAFKGLVFAYLQMDPPNLTNALTIAKEAIQIMPYDARTSVLVGRVLVSAGMEEKAVNTFKRAMKLDANNIEAPCCIADTRLSQYSKGEAAQEDLFEAARILSLLVAKPNPKDFMHCKLAQLYCAIGDFSSALSNFHAALSITPNYEEAKKGLDQLLVFSNTGPGAASGSSSSSNNNNTRGTTTTARRIVPPSSYKR